MAKENQLKITLVKGVATRRQKDNVRTLGLHKIGQSTVRPDSSAVRGLVRKVAHLVTVEEA